MNFIPDRAKALREMIRVTRPDGVIACRSLGLRRRHADAESVLG